MRIIYSLLLYALTPFILLRYVLRSRKNPAYVKRLNERFGYFKPPPKTGGIWVHAVSVGEAIAAIKLIKALQSQYPDVQFVVTCGTPTGSEVISSQLGAGVHHVYIPLDLPSAVRRFMAKVKPKIGIILETEIWPNLLHAAHHSGVKLLVSNMRLSEASFSGYRRFQSLVGNSLGMIDQFAVQTETDADRAVQLGAPEDRVSVVGNLKFEIGTSIPMPATSKLLARLAVDQPDHRPIWLAGSTHDGEEEIILRVHRALLEDWPTLLLILAPRHPERFNAVVRQCEALFSSQRRSDLVGEQALEPTTEVFILDSIGELPNFISASEFCFIGGSLVPVGGHNILEACHAGIAVLFGPHMHNFQQVVEQVSSAGAGVQIYDEPSLQRAANQLLSDPERRAQMSKAGKALIAQHRGALQKTLDMLSPWLS